MNNFFSNLASVSQNLTNRERVLVDYLLDHQPHGMLDSATGIAKQVGMSPSTVVRFFSKLGYASFADAQREVRTEIASKLASPSQRVALASRPNNTVAAIVENSFALDLDNLHATRESLDLADFEAVVQILLRPRSKGRLFIMGAKNSGAVAQYLHVHLNMCMREVHILDAQQSMLADRLLWVNEHDVLLAVSIRRYSKTVLQAARHFKHLGARVVTITDSPLAPIAALSAHRMLVRTASASPFDSYTSAFCLCNALISAVSMRNKKEVDAALKRGEAIWKQCGTFADNAA